MSDHTLTVISTWAEVAILLFMVWEAYGPSMGARIMSTLPLRPPPTGILGRIWENRVLVVAIPGLVFVGWLYLIRGPAIEETQNSTLIEWLRQAQSERDEARQMTASAEAQKEALVKWVEQAQRDATEANRSIAAAEAQKVTLIDWLQTAHHERDEARQDRDQLQKQMQDARRRAPSGVFPEVQAKEQPNPQVCADLLRLRASLLADKHAWHGDGSLEDEVHSVMRKLNCLSD
jgi:hypothetical protein